MLTDTSTAHGKELPVAKTATKVSSKKTPAKKAATKTSAKAAKAPAKSAGKTAAAKASARSSRAPVKATKASASATASILTLRNIAERLSELHEVPKRQANEMLGQVVEMIAKSLK